MEALLSVSSLLEKLPISKTSLYKMVQTRRIPFVRLNGKTLFFRESEVEKWLAEQNGVSTVGKFDHKAYRKLSVKRK